MSNSICMFVPDKEQATSIKSVNFVLETEIEKLRQPFFNSIYYLNLVTKGKAVLKIGEDEYFLEKGCIFFAFPAYLYEIIECEEFEYMYISFFGAGVGELLDNLKIDMQSPVFYYYDNLIDFWMKSIKDINETNISILTESVLLYTLSFLRDESDRLGSDVKERNLFEKMLGYVDRNYRDVNISLKMMSEKFSYSEKYLSLVFKKNMNMSFRSYLNNMRIEFAKELISKKNCSVSKIAERCGYNDSLYFSKVFKKIVGVSPSSYIKNKKGEI